MSDIQGFHPTGTLKSLQTNGTPVPDIETRLEARAAAFLETGMGLVETYQLCVDALVEIRRLRKREGILLRQMQVARDKAPR